MRTLLLRLLLLVSAFWPLHAFANSVAQGPHVRVELLARDATLRPDLDLPLGLHFEVEKGWHIYWSNPGDSGEPPRVRWTLPAALEPLYEFSPLKWPTPHRLVMGPLANYGYEEDVLLISTLHTVRADAARDVASLPIVADVTWLVCAESCIPGKAQLTLKLPISAPSREAPRPSESSARFAATERSLPLPPPSSFQLHGTLSPKQFEITVELGQSDKPARALFLPLDPDQIENAAEQEVRTNGSTLTLRLQRSEQLLSDITMLHGLLVLDAGQPAARSFAVDIPITPAVAVAPVKPVPAISAAPPIAQVAPPPSAQVAPPPSTPPMPFWLALAFALLGGVLLNLMPCVFPVLSVKALGLVEMSATDRRVARGHGLMYLGGILVSFWVLAGVLIALRSAGQQIGWGFHLQSPRFLIGLSAMLFFLGLNLLGVFELGIGLTQLGNATVGRHGYAGAFATGVLATVVATPCTAPFMGTAVGFALGQSAPAALLIFSLLGIGLALPYVLLPWIPGLLRVLPRPGAWMETFKQAMGFLLFVTVLWLAWVLGAQAGADGVVALLGGLLLVGLSGWVLHRWADRRAVSLLAAGLLLAGALLPGWQVTPQPGGKNGAVEAPQRNGSEDLKWERYSPEQLAAYRRAGRPVLVDFTADWCVSCKVNERLVLRDAEVRARVAELGVVAMKADWTNEDEVITRALQAFGRSGVPLYVLYGRDANAQANVLPAVLSTGIVLRALDALK